MQVGDLVYYNSSGPQRGLGYVQEYYERGKGFLRDDEDPEEKHYSYEVWFFYFIDVKVIKYHHSEHLHADDDDLKPIGAAQAIRRLFEDTSSFPSA